MTATHEASMVVQAHACVIEGVTYRFGIRRFAAEELVEVSVVRVSGGASWVFAPRKSLPLTVV